MRILAILAVAFSSVLAQSPSTPVQTRTALSALDGRLANHPKTKSDAASAKKAAPTPEAHGAASERAAPLRTPVPPVAAAAKPTKHRPPRP